MARIRIVDPPGVFFLAEIPHQHLHRQAALHFELRVNTFPGASELLAGDVGTNDINLASTKRGARFSNDHRQRIRLLSGR
jgi:hypothetical protein